MLFLLILLISINSQPCSPPIKLLDSQQIGSCDVAATTLFTYTLDTIATPTSFTISGWFTLDVKSTQEYSLFRVTMDEGDVTGTTNQGIRVAIVIHDEIVDLKYSTSSLQTQSSPFVYTIKKWFFAAITVNYASGGLNHYLWQPQSNLKITNAPLSLGTNFNTALANTAVVNVLYWGPYQQYCGKVDKLYFYENYYEPDQTHDWINLAFMEESVDLLYLFRLEDQIGQKVIGVDNYGYLGQNKGIDSYDPAPGYYISFQTQQYITMPNIGVGKSHFSIKFWFWSNMAMYIVVNIISSVGDCILFRRVYQGSQDQVVIMMKTAGANYNLRLKLFNNYYDLGATINPSSWTFISISLVFPDGIYGVSKAYYDSVIGTTQESNQITAESNQYLESTDDQLFLGDSRNIITNSFRLANFEIVPTYVNYLFSPKCIVGCQHSINSFTQQKCKKCSNFEQDYSCVASCATGSTGVQSAILPICTKCQYQCNTCLGVSCTSCNSGYYLQTTSCVLASACTAGFLADPISKKCTKCGDGVIDAGEVCDDNNFIVGDGCSNCTVDTEFTCSGAPSICLAICGNGAIDGVEECDDGQSLINGCTNCLIDSGYYCTGAPSVCRLLCGNGKRLNEDCDDGNLISNDGCSNCIIDSGYKCIGGSSSSSDTCTAQCPNSIIDQSEQCDDGNLIQNDGCYKCRYEIDWICNPTCVLQCGNGIIDQNIEECDDGNQNANDGCTKCKIDLGYTCDGTTCTAIPLVCGDGYKSSSEQCDDGNSDSGDGCSSLCFVETNYQCKQPLYIYNTSICIPICGNGIITSPEECDDGNTISGDGCDNKCQIEQICGDSIRDSREQCDDGNLISADGCTACTIDSGFYCAVIEGGSTDVCISCPDNCESCDSFGVCVYCYYGFVIYNKLCYQNCPQGYYLNTSKCEECPTNCLQCTQGNICMQCNVSTYLYADKCMSKCIDGYFPTPNAVLGNSCVNCYSPCIKCQSATVCDQCDEFYRLEVNTCVSCGMGSECIHCNQDSCLECIVGYQPNGKECKLIDANCGDGLHALTESCDDGNLSGGCVDCVVQTGYHCILEDNQGPDICFQTIPLNVSTYIDEVHFDSLFIQFDRPLLEKYNFTELLYINIPELEDYKYKFELIDLSKLQVIFEFYETVQNMNCNLNFSQPNLVVDKFGYSLVGMANDSSSDIAAYGLIQGKLNYFIYYSGNELAFGDTLAFITLSFMCFGLLTSLIFFYKIGTGQVWQIVYSLQIVSLMRLVNLRYSIHIYRVLDILNYMNLSFLPNIFTYLFGDSEMNISPKFQLDNYPPEFLLGGGGRFISLIAYMLILWGLTKILIHFIHIEFILNRLEDLDDYLKYQAFVRAFEIMFLDVMVSFIQSVQVFANIVQIINMIMAILLILIFIAIFIIFYRLVVRNDDAIRLELLHLRFSCIYDGFDIRNKLGKYFIYVPFIQKFIYALVFITTLPIIQIALICSFRILVYAPLFKFNPFISKLLLWRQFIQSLMDTMTIAVFLIYLNDSDTKSAKLSNGWLVFMAIIINIIQFTIWNIVLIFIKFQVPNYLLEELEADLQQKDEIAVKEVKKERFDEKYGNPKSIKIAQIAPLDYVEPQKDAKIMPENYIPPLKIPLSQIAPESGKDKQEQIVQSKSKEEKRPDSAKSEESYKTKLKKLKEKKNKKKGDEKEKEKVVEENDKLVDDFFG